MSNLGLDQTTTIGYYSYLERCVQHSNADVKMLALNDIERRLKEKTLSKDDFQSNILIAIINCLECSETKVGSIAIRLLDKLLPEQLNDKSIKDQLEKILLNSKELIRCRVYELAIKLSQQSSACHSKIEFILEKLIGDLDSEDILLKLNVLNLVSDLGLTDHGNNYLENKGVFAKVLRQIEQLDSNAHKTILVPGYLKFFGHIAATQPTKVIQGFPNMINSLFDCILDGNFTLLPVAFDTLGK